MAKSNLSENVNFYSLPLCESEIEIRFKHEDRPAVAVFEIVGGYVDKSPSREFPPEHVDPKVTLLGIDYEDDGSPVYAKDVDLETLEDEAVEKYWDEQKE